MISVVLPGRNPHPNRLHETLSGLAAQTLARTDWELLVVDNGSMPALSTAREPLLGELSTRLIIEPRPGLTPARLAGIHASSGQVVVFVDDDNVLAPNYLATVATHFAAAPTLAAAGGPVVPRWESTPPDWTREFWGLLALRERGNAPEIARGATNAPWPAFAPVGAGLAVRRLHALAYAQALEHDPVRAALDRRDTHLGSGGDNDLVFTALHAGGDVAYFPELRVLHLIPAHRLDATYLAQLNEGIMRTWVVVLALHGQCPWPPIAPWTVLLRIARAWWRLRAFRSPAHYVRWRGAAGQFRGQAEIAGLRPHSTL